MNTLAMPPVKPRPDSVFTLKKLTLSSVPLGEMETDRSVVYTIFPVASQASSLE